MIDTNNFTPWFGKIENVNDPLKNGRYQVRVFGYNTSNRGMLPTENLRWFSSAICNSAGSQSVGHSPTGYTVDSFVFGYYIDPECQDGIIMAGITGMPGGVNDVSEVATGEGGQYLETVRKNAVSGVPDARGETWDEPPTRYAVVYPYNKVYQSESGHIVEYDDTPGAER